MDSRTPDLATIRQKLTQHQPQLLPADRGHAAVSMILRDEQSGPEVLFIVRAKHDRDPWSGDIGFPGGRVDHGDPHPRQTAERETREELGLDLSPTNYLGRLDDLYGATLPILVSCFAYHLSESSEFQPNHEIADAFWFPLAELRAPERHHVASFTYRDQLITHPAVDLLGPNRTVLWGITYRLIRNFFALFELSFGVGSVDVDARP